MKYCPLLLSILMIAACKKDTLEHPDITTGLVANIALDGNALDSISGTHGTIFFVNPYFDRHNQPNKSMLFNRHDSAFIDFGDLAGLSFPNNQFTICCWINVPDTLAPMAVISKRNAFGPWEYSLDNHFNHAVFNLDNWVADGSTTVYGTDPLNASAPFNLATWTHFAFVADGTTLKLYVDGILQQGTDDHKANLFFSDTDAHFVIGNGGGYGQNYFFNGCIDDVRIYNRPLDASVIEYLAGL